MVRFLRESFSFRQISNIVVEWECLYIGEKGYEKET